MVEVDTDSCNYEPEVSLLFCISLFFKINFLKLVFVLDVLVKYHEMFVRVIVDEYVVVFLKKITKVYTYSSVLLKMVRIKCNVVLEIEVYGIVKNH